MAERHTRWSQKPLGSTPLRVQIPPPAPNFIMSVIDCYYYCRDDRTICSECNYYNRIVNQEHSKVIIEQIVAERILAKRRYQILSLNQLIDLMFYSDQSRPAIRTFYQWLRVHSESVWCTAKEAMDDYNKWCIMMKFWQEEDLPRFFPIRFADVA